jgi:hypothetical protein
MTMPSILRIGPFRFFFYANENGEPPHIHVQKDRMLAKFWLKPVSIARSTGFSPQDLSKLLGLVELHQTTFSEAWDDFFAN